MWDILIQILTQALDRFRDMLAELLPRLLGMLIIILLGWLLARALKIAVRRILTLVKFDAICENAGVAAALSKAALPPAGELLSRLVFWILWLCFLLLGVSVLGFAAMQEQISRFFGYAPQIFVALLILLVGLLVANFVSRAVLLAAVNANLPSARLLSGFSRFLILILTLTMALEQIALASRAVFVAFSLVFGAIMLGLAIAFGLGGRDVARRLLEQQFLEEKHEKEDEVSHI